MSLRGPLQHAALSDSAAAWSKQLAVQWAYACVHKLHVRMPTQKLQRHQLGAVYVHMHLRWYGWILETCLKG